MSAAPVAPPFDPARRPGEAKPTSAEPQSWPDLLAWHYLREAPRLPNAAGLGVATAPVEPWPHQRRVVEQCVEHYPRGYLFADEVGLGKTVEVALVLRQLVISGRVRRFLILAPRALLRQWQEELWEKACLAVPRLEPDGLRDVFDRRVALDEEVGGDLWQAPRLLVSSQLAKRRDRRQALLAAPGWDLVVVDEAHHARRRDPRPGRARPNRLLELLAGDGRAGLRDKSRCVYLLTATPMQTHPVELWDLLRVLGLAGSWGADEEGFLRYFQELRRPFAERDWRLLLGLLGEHLADAEVPPELRRAAIERLGEEAWERLLEFLGRDVSRTEVDAGMLRLDAAERGVLEALARCATPLAAALWRHTRADLRAAAARGELDVQVPERRPQNLWIDLGEPGRQVYGRIEEYIGEVYRRYEAERRGLGFVMTVYRRRLTSSFAAIRSSLERRLAGLDDDFPDVRDALAMQAPGPSADERAYLERFLAELATLGEDPKLSQLRADLASALPGHASAGGEHRTALVFSQYIDTLDFLRDALRADGRRVACYSGRGGERWEASEPSSAQGAWVTVGKEELKEDFRRGEIEVLLCTDAASEGLNLQTCALLINFDMPWNPMRVEQRIGRIDRLGQLHDEVEVRNYFYADTVEATIYQRLGDRIAWFETVVGALPPILHRVGEAIHEVAMAPRSARQRCLEDEVAALASAVEESPPDPLELVFDGAFHMAEEPHTADVGSGAPPLPASLDDLARVTCGSPWLELYLRPDPQRPGVFLLRGLQGSAQERALTFVPSIFERHPYSIELLTWGSPLFDDLLAVLEGMETHDQPAGLGLYRTEHPVPVSLFLRPDGEGARPVSCLAELLDGWSDIGTAPAWITASWTAGQESRAAALFSRQRRRVLDATVAVEDGRRRAERQALAEAGRRVLTRAVLVEIARARYPGLFEARDPLPFGDAAPVELARRQPSPYGELLGCLREPSFEIGEEHPYFQAIDGHSSNVLERRAEELEAAAEEIVAALVALDARAEAARAEVRSPSVAGVLERSWLAPSEVMLGCVAQSEPRLMAVEEVKPFVDAVPYWDDLVSAVEHYGESTFQDHEGLPPADHRWIEITGRVRPKRGFFVAPVRLIALDRRVAPASLCLFRLRPNGHLEDRILLVRHREIEDPELGSGLTLRFYSSRFARGAFRVELRPASSDPSYRSVVLEDVEDGDLTVVAELVEVVG